MGTRADEYNHGREVTQLATITDRGRRRRSARSARRTSRTRSNPFLRCDGKIGYSRWEHLGGVNDVKLFRMNPDCTQMVARRRPARQAVQLARAGDARWRPT